MKNWLDKYEYGGQAGYTDIPFDYNSAWGGQFAMGGSLPGSVGFTYARTQGAAPSNGPYAKKTKASAQDGKTIVQNLNLPKYEEPTGFLTGYGYGMSPQANVNIYGVGAYGEKKVSPRTTLSGNMSSQSVTYPGGSQMFMKPRYDVGMRYRFDNGGSMSYYQHGLDWKPKTISRDGSIIEDDRGQWAHPGKITKINSNQITMKGVDYPVLGISDTGDKKMMYPEQEYTFKGKNVTEIPMAQKGKTLPPIYTDDPRKVQAYQDSLSLYNKGIGDEKFLREHGMTNAITHEFPFSKVTSYGYANKPKGKIQPTSAVSQTTDPSHPNYYRAEWLKYKKPVQPYILQEEPTLNKKVTNITPISINNSFTPGVNSIQHPNIEIPNLPQGEYRTSYYDPEIKNWNERAFMTQEESDKFANEMSQRGYASPYGNVTQTKKINKKSTGGWLDKYN